MRGRRGVAHRRAKGTATTWGGSRGGTRAQPPSQYHPDDLSVYCWCQTEIIWVPQATIMACQTGSCGREGCHAP